jgi:hypothetical protein
VSDRKWLRPKVSAVFSAEYSAETEYSARATETESENSICFDYFYEDFLTKNGDEFSSSHLKFECLPCILFHLDLKILYFLRG